MSIHIAFVKAPTARYILAGQQTCESRLSKVRHPACNVATGDTLLFKSGNGVALATVSRVEVYESLRPLDIDALQSRERDSRFIALSARITSGVAALLKRLSSRHFICTFAAFLLINSPVIPAPIANRRQARRIQKKH